MCTLLNKGVTLLQCLHYTVTQEGNTSVPWGHHHRLPLFLIFFFNSQPLLYNSLPLYLYALHIAHPFSLLLYTDHSQWMYNGVTTHPPFTLYFSPPSINTFFHFLIFITCIITIFFFNISFEIYILFFNSLIFLYTALEGRGWRWLGNTTNEVRKVDNVSLVNVVYKRKWLLGPLSGSVSCFFFFFSSSFIFYVCMYICYQLGRTCPAVIIPTVMMPSCVLWYGFTSCEI